MLSEGAAWYWAGDREMGKSFALSVAEYITCMVGY